MGCLFMNMVCATKFCVIKCLGRHLHLELSAVVVSLVLIHIILQVKCPENAGVRN